MREGIGEHPDEGRADRLPSDNTHMYSWTFGLEDRFKKARKEGRKDYIQQQPLMLKVERQRGNAGSVQKRRSLTTALGIPCAFLSVGST